MSEMAEDYPLREQGDETLLICEVGHHIRTSQRLRVCPARSENAHDGVFGPPCGAEITSILLDLDVYDALRERR